MDIFLQKINKLFLKRCELENEEGRIKEEMNLHQYNYNKNETAIKIRKKRIDQLSFKKNILQNPKEALKTYRLEHMQQLIASTVIITLLTISSFPILSYGVIVYIIGLIVFEFHNYRKYLKNTSSIREIIAVDNLEKINESIDKHETEILELIKENGRLEVIVVEMLSRLMDLNSEIKDINELLMTITEKREESLQKVLSSHNLEEELNLEYETTELDTNPVLKRTRKDSNN